MHGYDKLAIDDEVTRIRLQHAAEAVRVPFELAEERAGEIAESRSWFITDARTALIQDICAGRWPEK